MEQLARTLCTGSKLSLRILLWNASVVQKHFSNTWHDGLVLRERKIPSSPPWRIVSSVHVLNSNSEVVLIKTQHGDSWVSHGLKIACTFAQQLGWAFVGPCHPSAHGPLLKSESWKRSNSRGFTSVQKFHSHTDPAAAGFFGKTTAGCPDALCGWRRMMEEAGRTSAKLSSTFYSITSWWATIQCRIPWSSSMTENSDQPHRPLK